MRVLVQRCKEAQVTVGEELTGRIESGLMLLVGITHEDTEKDAIYLADKIAGLRIFEDEQEKMNLSLVDVGGAVLSVSQFTLYGDCRKENGQALQLQPDLKRQNCCMKRLISCYVIKGFRLKPDVSER